jgi:hypothetical protein
VCRLCCTVKKRLTAVLMCGARLQAKAGIIPKATASIPTVWPTQPRIRWVRMTPFVGIKRSECEADRFCPYTAEVKNALYLPVRAVIGFAKWRSLLFFFLFFKHFMVLLLIYSYQDCRGFCIAACNTDTVKCRMIKIAGKVFVRKQSQPDRGTIPTFAWRD